MRHATTWTLLAATLAAVATSTAAADAPPADRVVAMYFHRTQRCPTCQKMGRYAEEAVDEGFAEPVDEGRVEFHYIDFQQPGNKELAEAYGVSGPALIVAQVRDGKVRQHKELKEIWAKVRDKADFLAYVRENIAAYMK
jgi:thiol-disulfide isomerase/thioredoxin